MEKSSIRTFNSAKKFADEVLHPLIKNHSDAKIRSVLGAINDEEATLIHPNMRVIKRFNAMKERIIILQTLLTEVQPTIELNGRKSEIALIQEISIQLSTIEDYYEGNEEELLENNGHDKPKLKPMFKQMSVYLDKLYNPLQRIMTKNKLLFFGDDNEYADNETLMERIKSENRQA